MLFRSSWGHKPRTLLAHGPWANEVLGLWAHELIYVYNHVFGRFRVDVGPIWGRFRVDFHMILRRCWVGFGSIWDQFRIEVIAKFFCVGSSPRTKSPDYFICRIMWPRQYLRIRKNSGLLFGSPSNRDKRHYREFRTTLSGPD